MPQVIGALIAAAVGVTEAASATALTVGAVTVTYGSIYSVIGATVLGAVEMGLSSLLAPSAPKQSGQLTLQQPIPFRRRIYGQAKVGGSTIFWKSVNGNLCQLIAIASHEIDSFLEYWVSDREVALNSEGYVVNVIFPPNAQKGQFNPDGRTDVVRYVVSRGDTSKVANDRLIALFPDLWNAQCIGVGVADMLLIQNWVKEGQFSTVYPGGQQTPRVVVHGARVYDCTSTTQDPNNYSTWAYSDNAVNVVLDYMTHTDGWRMLKDTFLTGMGGAVTIASAAHCNTTIPLVDGGSEALYRLWGFYDFNEEPRQVLARLLAAFGGWLQPFPDGTIGIHDGAWVEPTFTITDDMILGFEVQHWVGEFDAVNEVRASFNDKDNDYEDMETSPWQDTVDIQRRGYIKSITIDTRHCPSFTQTRRMQKIALLEASPEWTFTLTCNSLAIQGRSQRFLNLQMDHLGLSMTCRVTGFSVNLKTMVATIKLASFAADSYAWDPESEEGPPPVIPPDSSTQDTVETPQGFQVTVENGPIMMMSCLAPEDRGDLTAKFEILPPGATGWTVISQGNTDYQCSTGILSEGVFSARVSFFGPAGAQSFFAEIDGIEVSNSIAAPAAPTGLTAVALSPTGSGVHVAFTSPNSSTFDHAEVWRGANTTFSQALEVSGQIYGSANQALSYTDPEATPGTWYYWVVAYSSTDNGSSPTGPVSVVV